MDFVADRRQVKSEIGEDLAGGGVIGEEISVDKNNTSHRSFGALDWSTGWIKDTIGCADHEPIFFAAFCIS